MRFAAMYPAARLLLKFLRLIKPSLAARRVAHLAFTKAKIEKRLQRKTDRKDFMTYVSLSTARDLEGEEGEVLLQPRRLFGH